jgi:hypothetical protein
MGAVRIKNRITNLRSHTNKIIKKTRHPTPEPLSLDSSLDVTFQIPLESFRKIISFKSATSNKI